MPTLTYASEGDRLFPQAQRSGATFRSACCNGIAASRGVDLIGVEARSKDAADPQMVLRAAPVAERATLANPACDKSRSS
jgi:hypothetical protein